MGIFKLPEYFLVFDVESVGLHGEAFAYGATLLDTQSWTEERRWLAWCPASQARGRIEDFEWVQKNIKNDSFYNYPLSNPKELRDSFWKLWMGWKGNSVMLAADVPWPVEARFLAACVEDDPHRNIWNGPYPLIDIASVRLAAGLDPLATVERLDDELPAHNPLADARQSARLLSEALQRVQAGTSAVAK